MRSIGPKPVHGDISTRKGFPSEKLCRGRTRFKRSLPDGNSWKAFSVVIMAGEYIGLSPKRKFGEQPRERDFAGCLVGKNAKQDTSGRHGLHGLLRIQRQTAGSKVWRPAVALAAFIDRPASCSSNRRWYKQKDPLYSVQQSGSSRIRIPI